MKRTCYEQTGDAPTDKVVIVDSTTTLELRDDGWHGPFEMNDEEIDGMLTSDMFEKLGKLTSAQVEKVMASAES
jgi:hypothetical protein